MSKSAILVSTFSMARFLPGPRTGLAGIALLIGFLHPLHATAQTTTDTTYVFTGACSDCTGTGVGYLTLQNYTPNTALSYSNFVSFSYTSNLSSFVINSQGMQYSIPNVNSPGESITFNSDQDVDQAAVLSVGMTGVLSTTPGAADFDFLAQSVDGSFTNSVQFLSCLTACASGVSPWQLSAGLSVESGPDAQFPGGKSGQINDQGSSHSWALQTSTVDTAVIAAPEIDATSAAAALTLLLGSLAVLQGRRLPRLETTDAIA